MPDPTLQATALRYAAGDLSPEEVTAFETRLADDQDARDALAEAVRLSAQAIGQLPPTPRPSTRAAIRDRLNSHTYRGPFAWVAVGGAVVAACTIIGLVLANKVEPSTAAESTASRATAPDEATPMPRATEQPSDSAAPAVATALLSGEIDQSHSAACDDDSLRSVAEIWAGLSSHESVEKARDDELRWRQRVRELSNPHVSASAKAGATCEDHQP